MKRRDLALALLAAGSGAGGAAPATAGMRELSSLQLSRLMGTGWNLGNALEAIGGETAWGNPATTQALMTAVKAAGFSTVRIPVSWKQYADASDLISPAWMARVAQVVGVSSADVSLHPSGMGAIYRALRLVTDLFPDRPTVQFGFPYLDSLKLQERLGTGCRFFPVGDADALEALEAALDAREVGAVFCEVPGNPLMRTVDLARLAALALTVPALALDASAAALARATLTLTTGEDHR